MASVAWKKLHGLREVNKMLLHDARYDSNNVIVTYRNRYIDITRTKENYIIGDRIGDRFEDKVGKTDYYAIKHRITAIDIELPPQRRRKDRVIAISFCVTAPEGLDREKERQFFELAYRHIKETCGGPKNLSRGYVHYDERHEYLDAVTGERRMSRAHMHVVGIPFVPDKGINGKLFMTKTRMIELNKSIDHDCRSKLGVKFLTGEKGLTGRSVEDLQAASVSMAKKTALAKLQADAEKAQREADTAKQELSVAQEELSATKDDLRITSAELASSKNRLSETNDEINKLKKDYSSLAERYNSLVRAFNTLVNKVKQLGLAVDTKLLSHHHSIGR